MTTHDEIQPGTVDASADRADARVPGTVPGTAASNPVAPVQAGLVRLERACVIVAGLSMVVMMFVTTFDLLSRKFLSYSIPSLYEFTEDYLMVSLVFLSISYVYSEGGHVRVTLLEEHLPGRFRRVWDKLHQLMALALFALIAFKGWEAARQAWLFNEKSNSVLAYPLAPALFMVPLGSALLCLRILQSIFTGSTPRAAHELPPGD